MKILCPQCSWEPDGKPYWRCSCGHFWDTFLTAGRCPSCHRVWKDTQCHHSPIGCGKFSPHLDWYQDLDEILIGFEEELKQSQ